MRHSVYWLLSVTVPFDISARFHKNCVFCSFVGIIKSEILIILNFWNALPVGKRKGALAWLVCFAYCFFSVAYVSLLYCLSLYYPRQDEHNLYERRKMLCSAGFLLSLRK